MAQPTQRGWTPTDYLFCLLYFVQIVAIGGWPRGVGSPALSFRASTIRAVGLATCRMLCALWIAMWINGFAVWMTNIQFEYESFGLRKLLRRAAPPQKAEFIWRSSTFAVTLKNACYILTYPKSHTTEAALNSWIGQFAKMMMERHEKCIYIAHCSLCRRTVDAMRPKSDAVPR